MILAALAVAANVLAIDPAEADAVAARLIGQRFTIAADHASVTIDDVAGDGPPIVGVVARRGDASWLDAADGRSLRLDGPLARPRIAGPGYTVWITGAITGDAIRVARLGVLRRPQSRLSSPAGGAARPAGWSGRSREN